MMFARLLAVGLGCIILGYEVFRVGLGLRKRAKTAKMCSSVFGPTDFLLYDRHILAQEGFHGGQKPGNGRGPI